MLKVRARDVLTCRPVDAENCDFGPRWKELKVPEQVQNAKDSMSAAMQGGSVRIPAAYKAGITKE